MRHTPGSTKTHTAAMPSTPPQADELPYASERNAYMCTYTILRNTQNKRVARARERRVSGG